MNMSDDMGTRDEMPQSTPRRRRSIADSLRAIDEAIIDLNWHLVLETPFTPEDLEQLSAMSRILPLTAQMAEVINKQEVFVDKHGVRHVVHKPTPQDEPIWASPGYDLARWHDASEAAASAKVEQAIRYATGMGLFPRNTDPEAERYPTVSETTGEKTVLVVGGHADSRPDPLEGVNYGFPHPAIDHTGYMPLSIEARLGLLGVGVVQSEQDDSNPSDKSDHHGYYSALADFGNDAHGDFGLLMSADDEISTDNQDDDISR
jgi:hypothetical protein